MTQRRPATGPTPRRGNARAGWRFQPPDGVPYHRSTGNTADLRRGLKAGALAKPLRNRTMDTAPNPKAAADDPPAGNTCFDYDAETAATRGPHKFIYGVGTPESSSRSRCRSTSARHAA